MAELIILVGPPFSGKTEFAETFVLDNPLSIRISKKDIRKSIKFKKEGALGDVHESYVNSVFHTMIQEGIDRGLIVLLDDRNLKKSQIDYLINKYKKQCNISIVPFNETIDVLYKRNNLLNFANKEGGFTREDLLVFKNSFEKLNIKNPLYIKRDFT